MHKLKQRLLARQQKGNERKLKTMGPLIDFASNDYLGLARSDLLMDRTKREWETLSLGLELNGCGSTGSRLVTGQHGYIEQLENQISRYHGFEAALVFGCGYLANSGLLSCLANEDDQIFYDAHVHASMQEGIRLSRAQAFPFKHQDLGHLEKRLKQAKGKGQRFIVVESVYSMDGSQADLIQISRLANEHEAFLIVDEAHAIGLLGPQGRGLVAQHGLTSHVFAQVVTFGKALGAYGAAILGGAILKDYLINFARPFIYTTALPLMNLVVIKCAYELLPRLDEERKRLSAWIHYVQAELSTSSMTAIQPVEARGNRLVQSMAEQLAFSGFDVRAMMSPTVRNGQERLRICLHSFNTQDQVQGLVQELKRIRKT